MEHGRLRQYRGDDESEDYDSIYLTPNPSQASGKRRPLSERADYTMSNTPLSSRNTTAARKRQRQTRSQPAAKTQKNTINNYLISQM